MKTSITSNVLEDISRRLQGRVDPDSKSALVVFNGSTIKLEDRLRELKDLKQRGLNISLGFSFMADRIIDTNRIINDLSPHKIYREEDIFKLQDISREYSIIIGPNITMNTLSKVALGMVDSFVSNVIWTFLYQGKKVYLDYSSVRNYLGEESKNKAISTMIESHISTLKDMGAEEINSTSYKQVFIGPNTDSPIPVNSQETSARVLVERDILSMTPNTNLMLPKGSIITPLAKDRASEKNIIIDIK
ncbi:MAG: flavoprotein [Tissierellaceae bacterium]